MPTRLVLFCSSLSPEQLQGLTGDFYQTLQRETEVQASWPEQAGGAGSKGDPLTVGTLLLSLASSGAAVALINVFKAFFERNSSIEVELQRDDGSKVRIRAENVRGAQLQHTLDTLRDFAGGQS